MNRFVLASLCMLMLLSACASKPAVKPEEPAPQKADNGEELILPDIGDVKDEPAEKKTERQAPAKKSDEQYVMLNFENADIETVIATIGEMLKINYILAPGVTGKITIQSHNKIPVSELFSTFQTALEFNGLTAVKEGSFYRIVQIDTARQQPVQVQAGKKLALPKDSSFVTQEVPLEYVKANDVANIMRNLMPRGTDIIVYEPTNMLIVTAPPSGLVKFLKLLEAIDIPSTERDSIKTFVYNVENGEAKKLAEILKNIYKKDKAASAPVRSVSPAAPTPTTPTPVAGRPRPGVPAAPAAGGATISEGLAGDLEGDLVIEAYDAINALLIKTTPRGYLTLLETIKRLDIQPKQVLIEVLIAEISLNDSTQLGIEWLLKTSIHAEGRDFDLFAGNVGDTSGRAEYDTSKRKFVPAMVGSILAHPAGGFASVIDPRRFSLLLTAAATAGNVNVLASPHILALDNKEAKIEIGDEVPVATSITNAGTDATVITNTTSQVQFKSVGTILTVTPQINEKKQVTLKVSQEVSEIGDTVKIGSQDFTGFKQRKANTTAIVQDGHTLVIGGIISERIIKSRSGLPFLSRIPILGYLFGTTTDSIQKRELILLITPHVVADKEEADMLTEDYKNRIRDVKKKIDERQRKMLQSDIHLHDPQKKEETTPD
ncbi:MAG: hypothetical protein OHK006_09930 [Thermodesulfovibrionales bacterium]